MLAFLDFFFPPTALTDCKLWAIDRTVFQAIMMKTGQAKQKQHLDFLKSVKLLQDVPEAKLVKIADALEEVCSDRFYFNDLIVINFMITVQQSNFSLMIIKINKTMTKMEYNHHMSLK